MAFSPNGNKLAFSGWLKTDWESTTVIEIWDAIAGECLHKIETGYFQDDIVFSPNGTQLWSISLAGNVNVYDPSTGKCLQSLEECAEQASASIERSDPIYRAKLHAKRLQQIRDCFSEEQGFVCSNKASELDISDDRAWILREQEPVLRLPPEYRPRAFAEHKNFCAIGTSSGQVLCFQFSFESLVMG
jgi:WD40 repeat protein